MEIELLLQFIGPNLTFASNDTRCVSCFHY